MIVLHTSTDRSNKRRSNAGSEVSAKQNIHFFGSIDFHIWVGVEVGTEFHTPRKKGNSHSFSLRVVSYSPKILHIFFHNSSGHKNKESLKSFRFGTLKKEEELHDFLLVCKQAVRGVLRVLKIVVPCAFQLPSP